MTRYATFLLLLSLVFVMPGATLGAAADPESLVRIQSAHDVPTTVQRLQTGVANRGAILVATVDHAAAAQAKGLSLRPTVLVVFGNPLLGTPLMQSRQTVGIDLPMRVLVWQDEAGRIQVGYTPPAVIAARHGITDKGEVIDKMAAAIAILAAEAAQP